MRRIGRKEIPQTRCASQGFELLNDRQSLSWSQLFSLLRVARFIGINMGHHEGIQPFKDLCRAWSEFKCHIELGK